MSPARNRQDDHIAITGAGSGIGRAIALRLAEDGAKLSLFGRRLHLLENCAKEARIRGASVVVCGSLDITDRSAISTAFEGAASQLGALYALVANAGQGGHNKPGPEDAFERLVNVNLVGTYHCLRAAQKLLHPGPGVRHLLVTSSILARIGVPAYTGYCASKTGLLGLVRALAAELAGDEVQVNALCPGWVNTEMAWEGIEGMAQAMGTTRDEAYAFAMQAVPLGRMSEPADIAGMVSWLLSDDARGVTGQSLDMNGGAFMI